eukprot:TRINITY_DN2262_c0_g1_i1.p1 TRINITY_DN2262_c0_g1~~TRINITY_DN2262_c0_g1_i1.p1  ORF type:complete len:183 (+),score=29.21 TRINITY_DN2262_c0_g1_i1:50-598(+)
MEDGFLNVFEESTDFSFENLLSDPDVVLSSPMASPNAYLTTQDENISTPVWGNYLSIPNGPIIQPPLHDYFSSNAISNSSPIISSTPSSNPVTSTVSSPSHITSTVSSPSHIPIPDPTLVTNFPTLLIPKLENTYRDTKPFDPSNRIISSVSEVPPKSKRGRKPLRDVTSQPTAGKNSHTYT